MLRTLRRQGARAFPSNSRARRRQERDWRQWPVRHRPFSSPAPGRGIGAPISPIPLHRRRSESASSILHRHLPHQPGISASILPPYAAPLLGRSVCDSLWPGKPSTKSQEPPLQGRVKPGRNSSTPCDLSTSVRSSPCVRYRSRNAAVRTRLQGHKVFRAPRKRPSAYAPARWRRQGRTSFRRSPAGASVSAPSSPSQTARLRPHQRSRVVLV